ncbi:CLUMA_CG008829, isoform A [Clunio marinus]|uniref:CLUMA_CG008829, isoform A n=1 Tax=Clunio marinus TaxID=568069 RepID=A0A1J1I4W0_9DIPT|nr:CLUMA_CG008829, isoform A [Clunio marinus]
MRGSNPWKNFYICFGYLPKDENISRITGIGGENMGSRTNVNVTALYFSDHYLSEISLGFDNFLPNIEFFSMRGTQLKTVNLVSLQQFPNMKYLWLHENEIETIEVNAFSHTPSLEVINLSTNHLKSIPYNIFQPFRLIVLQMRENECIDESADSPQTVNRLIAKIDILCSPLGDTIQTLKRLHDEIMPKQNDLEETVINLQEDFKIMNDKVLEMEGDVPDLLLIDPNLIEDLENLKNEMDEEHENVNKRINSMEEIVNKIAIPLNKGSITRDYCSRRSEG